MSTPHGFDMADFLESAPNLLMFSKTAQGKRLMQTQLALELSNAALAKKAGVEPHAVSQYRSGTRTIPSKALAVLKEEFGVTSDWIIFGDASALPQGLYAKIRAKAA